MKRTFLKIMLAMQFASFLAISDLVAQNLQLETHWWQPNGVVYAIVEDEENGMVYLGGNFTSFSPKAISYGVQLSTESNDPDYEYAYPNGNVLAAVPDGKGGWFIGGRFTMVGDSLRNRIAHVNEFGAVTERFSGGIGFDNDVTTLLLDGTTLYAGGRFISHGTSNRWKKFGTLIDESSGMIDLCFPEPNNNVNCVISDGNGGWYIAGSFTMVGDSIRHRIAQISAEGEVTAWNPRANNSIFSLFLSGNILYVGGNFTNIGDASRKNIAALDIKTGIAIDWNPNADFGVNDIIVYDNKVYVGGSFSSIGGALRNNIASLDITTGSATAWNPNADNYVSALKIIGTTVYAVGGFNIIGGQVRNYIAALSATTGLATSWNPNADSPVFTIDLTSTTAYVGGMFSTMSGTTRNRLASIDLVTGAINPWNPNVSSSGLALIKKLQVKGGKVYTAGQFTNIGSKTSNNIGCIDAVTGVSTTWEVNANSNVNTFCISEGKMYIGGDFTSIGGESRNRLAAIDIKSSSLTDWKPEANFTVNALVTKDNIIYAGGDFTFVGNQNRNRVAAIETLSGSITAWNPNANNTVNSLMINENIVYIGGDFTAAGGATRNRIAAIDIATGNATAWNPSSNGTVYALVANENSVFAGGSFTNIGGVARNRIAALDKTAGNASAWDPDASNSVLSLAIEDNSLFIGGSFTSIGGLERNRIACLDTETGIATEWAPKLNGSVQALGQFKGNVYAGGGFTTIGGESRNNIACIDASTGELTDWDPNANGTIYSMALEGSLLYVGGLFTSIGGELRNRIASLDKKDGTATAWNPNASNAIYTLGAKSGKVYAGGSFTTIGGETRQRIACLDAKTGNATEWTPNANNIVRKILIADNTVYVGGSFTSIGGKSRNRIAELDIESGNATDWNPNANNTIRDMLLYENTLYVGGEFSGIGGVSRLRLAAVDISTGSVTGWNPSIVTTPSSQDVYTLANEGSLIYVGGTFTYVGSKSRNRFAALDGSTGIASDCDLNMNSTVQTISQSRSKVYVGGLFTNAGNRLRTYFAVYTYYFSLNYKSGENGYLIGETIQNVKYGESGTSLKAEPNFGYHFVKWSDDVTANPRADENVTGNISVTAEFAINTYTISYTAGSNGSLTGILSQTLNHGENGTSVSAEPNVGYHFVKWSDEVTANPRTEMNVTGNVSVTAVFAINTYNLNYTAGTHGSVAGILSQTVNHGESGTSVTAEPNLGYHFVKWSDDVTENPRTDLNVTASVSVIAEFMINTYTLNYLAGANGSVAGASQQSVIHGAGGSYVTAIPNSGYHFLKWSDNVTANPRNDMNITGDISVTAEFAINSYLFTYTAWVNGTITGISPQTVNHGANGTSVTAVPNTGYHFVKWSDNVVTNPRIDLNATGNLSVNAEFSINTYTLTYIADANGSISGLSFQTLNHGASATAVTAIPNTGYHFVRWSDLITANPRTDVNVSGDISVTAEFAINNYNLTYTAGTNGSIIGNLQQTVSYGANGTSVTAEPNVGYHFIKWSDNVTNNPRIDENVTENISARADFVINTYTLIYSAGVNGSIIGNSSQNVNHGENGSSVTALPSYGYHFVKWSDDVTANPRTEVNVTGNINVSAEFAINTYTLSYIAGENGSVAGTLLQSVNHGESGTTVTAEPNAGYHFTKWSDNMTANPRTDVEVLGNISVTAKFSVNKYVVSFTITFASNPVNGAKVVINDHVFETDVNGVVQVELMNGVYPYYIIAEGFHFAEGEVTVDGNNVDVQVMIQPVNVDAITLSNVKVYPNPFSDELNIESEFLINRVLVLNMLGQTLLNYNPYNTSQKISFNLNNLKPSTYVIVIYGVNGERVTKMLVKDL